MTTATVHRLTNPESQAIPATNESDQAKQLPVRPAPAILAVIQSLSKAHHDKNADAFAAQFAPNAAIFNLAPPLIHRGVDLQEKEAWFDTWDGPIEIEPRDFNITISGDTAFAYGYLRLAGNKKGVDQPVSFWMRETLCLERKRNAWKIVHEHTSVPFYMDETLRPAFDLKPS